VLLVPSWASAGNALATLNGAWDKVRTDATLRFMMVAAVFYGLSTFEGSFMAIRAVNSLSHYTDWTVGHVHAGVHPCGHAAGLDVCRQHSGTRRHPCTADAGRRAAK
jgi:cbb3-type cytochrome oxidase subunit 1